VAETATSLGATAVVVAERLGLTKRLVKRIDGSDGAEVAGAATGIERHAVGPGETLLVAIGEAELPAPGYDADTGTLVVEISSSQVVFRLSGEKAQAVVAKAAAIDLDDRHFPVLASAVCRFGAYRVLLHRAEANSYDLHVDRSLGKALRDYLLDLGAEFGVTEG